MNQALSREISDLATPALLLDLDVVEANVRSMQNRAEALGVRLRPHVKTHKCLEIAGLQRAAGARGITVSTLEEARAFAAGGFRDITWAFPLNLSRLDEALELTETADLAVTVDTVAAVDALEEAGRPVGVWIEVDCGYGRSGVDPARSEAVALAERIASSRNLDLRGGLTHAGHTYGGTPDEIVAIAEEERAVMVDFRAKLKAAGLRLPALSVGSTPGMTRVRDLTGVDEARPGNYALFDYTQLRLGSCELGDCAATVLASVVSAQPHRDRCVADCGALAMSKDLGPDEKPAHYGRLFTDLAGESLDPAGRVLSVSQEHAVLSISRSVGSRVRVLPNHSCLTVANFDAFVVVRGTEVIDEWKIWRDRGPGARIRNPA